jgi:hypothetical protein
MADAIRIISAPPAEAEAQVNAIHDRYQPLNFTVAVAKDEVVVTVILVNRRELSMAGSAIAMPGVGRPPFGA